MTKPQNLFASLALAVLVLAGLACAGPGAAVYSLPPTYTAQPTQTDTATPTPTRAAPTPTQTHTGTPTQAPHTCVVSAEVLHLRSCAGVGCSVLAWLPQGAVITPTGTRAGTWWEVTTQAGLVGWIYAEWIICP